MTGVNDVPIRDETIRLGQFLKLAGLIDSGADAKAAIADGLVIVNELVERRRGRQLRSGDIRMHWMPSANEQVTIAAPSGDMARAFIMGSLPIDGNMVAPDAGSPTMDLGGGTLRIIGNVYIDGDVEVTGDVVATGVSLVHHTHGGVVSGGSNTQEPNG